ncbi:hypothetical protein [Halobacteriovorax sp. HLS]|uniref:hypothetical protein n=1 Tax=Halobacteriovorax sp. HLS TaxID=2234000 RepID=UPI000FD9471C|nr:hypothetical protein [Halobacteriovorax sp. HLS]
MKFDLFLVKIFIISLISINAFSNGLESSEIILASSSGKSIVISNGRLHGLKDGQVATFFIQSGSLDFPKLEKLAEGELVRSLDNKSYWFLHKVFNPGKINKSVKVVMDIKSKHMMGNRKFKVVNRKRVYPESTTNSEVTYENENGIPQNLVHAEDDYVVSKKIVDTKVTKEHDIEIHQFDTWAKRNGLTKVDDFMREFERKYVDENFKDSSVAQQESDRIKRTIYRAQIDGFLSKVNNMKYGLTGFYYDQEKDKNMIFLKERLDVQNVYETARQDRKRKRVLSETKARKIDRDGDLWSADFSDDGLRRYMVQSGIEEEERRQYESLTQKSGNELSIRISSGLVSHSSSEDLNHQNKGYSLSLGYEYHLMRTSMSLLKYSIEIFAQRSIENIDLGGINGRFATGSFGGQLLYYFYNNPASIQKWAWYGGLGMRRGNAEVSSVELSIPYEFQVTGLPIWSVGTKYRFRTGDSFEDDIPVGAGFNIRLSGERMQLSSITSVEDNINSSLTLNDIKLTVGMSFYF